MDILQKYLGVAVAKMKDDIPIIMCGLLTGKNQRITGKIIRLKKILVENQKWNTRKGQ